MSTHDTQKMGVKSVSELSHVIGIKKGIMNQQLSLTIRGTFVSPFCSIQNLQNIHYASLVLNMY